MFSDFSNKNLVSKLNNGAKSGFLACFHEVKCFAFSSQKIGVSRANRAT